MKVFKFGGASVKDAAGIKNVVEVLKKVGHNQTVMVVSAMGKTTNAMEVIVNNYFNNPQELQESIQETRKYHQDILMDLFEDSHVVFNKVADWFNEMQQFLQFNKSPNYDYVYDQVVPFGELISTTIVSEYLNQVGLQNDWLDVRNHIKTDDKYRDGNVYWEQTQLFVNKAFKDKDFVITQGFIGSDSNRFTTTLGREGSDYTAAILAYCLNAESVTIWKDVPGVLNADPRYFDNAILLDQISYREAIELAFYGASVIHPKTLQPLQRKEIPFFVKSFIDPAKNGTSISKGVDLKPETPCFIVKKNQHLLSISSLDFSFMMEDNISEIFALLHEHKLKVNVIQNSAISFSLCLEDKYNQIEAFKKILSKKYLVNYTPDVSLFTIRHYTTEAVNLVEQGKDILLKQTLGNTVQVVVG
jgi:aspartate kinase